MSAPFTSKAGIVDSTDTDYLVVLNDEEQYSLWESRSPAPAGWRAEGFRGSREDCLAHIERVWTDMRPLSVRVAADSAAAPTNR